MSHLCLQDSHLIKGQNYSNSEELNSLLADPEYHSVILYPGQNSKNITSLTEKERSSQFLKNKKLRIVVIDGTWATAAKMVHQSENLQKLPRICFTPEKPSNFRVRKQPESYCYSTIEAIHHTIDLFSQSKSVQRPHDHLIEVFNSMVEKQLSFISEVKMNLREASYRRESQGKTGQAKVG